MTWRVAPAWAAAAAAAYCGAASLGYWLGSISTKSAPSALWPAIGIGVVVVYLGGARMAWTIFAGGLAAELLRGAPLDMSIANGLVSTANPVAVAWTLRARRFEPDFSRLRNALVLIVAAPLVTVIGATLGTATIEVFRDESTSLWQTWLTWWTGDFAGVLLVSPILFEIVERVRSSDRPLVPSWRSTGLLFAAALGVALLVFTRDAPVAFLVLPVIVWAGLAGDALTAAVVNAVIAGVAWVVTPAGDGPLAGSNLNNSLLALAGFTATVGMSSLVLCAIAAERQQAYSEIEDAARALESRVRARTRELREARRVAEDASRAKSTFLASMSHEIRTPMIGVTGMLEVLRRTELTEPQRRMVATAESSAHSLLQIIGDILDFSKIEAGRLDLAPSTFALPPLVAGAAETFMPVAAGKGLRLTWSIDERLADAHIGDQLRLRQIISNFLSNAVKFTELGGIDVSARVVKNGDWAQTVEIAVVDTGIGVSAEQQRRLFEEFAQADAATAQRFGGTGLGLTICKQLAVLMGGEVTMQSEPGVGTTMRLTVPLPVGDPAAVDVTARGPSLPRLARPKPSREAAEREGSLLLLVEDHPVSRRVLTQQLDTVGFHVDCARDGQEAFELFLTGRHSLVLTDLHMPRMDGYELARAIRRHEQETGAARTPIVTLTADVMKGEPERCIAAGMDDFAAKPTTIQVLAAKLQRWLPELDWPAAPQETVEENGARFGGAVLDDLTGGDEQLVTAVMNDFISATNADVDALADAIDAQDYVRVRRSAHRIVGASRIIGAAEVASLATQLEQAAAHSGEWPDLRRLLQRLEAAATRIASAIDRLSSAGPTPSA